LFSISERWFDVGQARAYQVPGTQNQLLGVLFIAELLGGLAISEYFGAAPVPAIKPKLKRESAEIEYKGL
jgi:hypothetical protein